MTIFGKVNHTTQIPPRKLKNKERRTREHLTEAEVDKIIVAARQVGRYGHRDATLVLLAYRHGLRVSELLSLRWSQVDLAQEILHVTRKKRGIDSTHPLYGVEIRALRKLRRDNPHTQFVFVSQRKGPLTEWTFRKILARAGERAKLEMPIHPHMLRHATGFKLANEGQNTRVIQHYLGHRNIQHTVRYTQLSRRCFQGFWKD